MKRRKQLCALTAMIALFLTVLDIYISIKIVLSNKFIGHVASRIADIQQNVYTYDKTKWIRNTTVCADLSSYRGKQNFQQATITMRGGKVIKIYIHDPMRDYLSNFIYRKRPAEHQVFQIIYKHIWNDTSISFIDLGSNIGVYTLQVAKLGRKVIAFEASRSCVQHLCASVEDNDFQQNVTIIHNAVGSNHEDVNFILTESGDYGINFVDKENIKETLFKHYGNNTYGTAKTPIKSVTLDDLLIFPKFIDSFKKVFIKIDIEGMEALALDGAHMFFQKVDVTGVYMEWIWHKSKPSGDVIIDKMTSWNFIPYDCDSVSNSLYKDLNAPCIRANILNSTMWPTNILWIPK